MASKKATFEALYNNLKGMVYYFMTNSTNRIVRSRANLISLDIGIEDDSIDGYTDGSLIHAKSSIKFLPGLVFHELGHLLYTWFRGSRVLIDNLQAGEGIPDELIHVSTSKYLLKQVNDELKDDKRFAMFFGRSLLHFSNIVEDSYLERTLLANYKVLFAKSLVHLREHMWETDIPSIQSLQDQVDKEEITELFALWALFLSYGKYGKLKREDNSELSLPIVANFKKFSNDYLKVVKETRKIERFQLTILFVLENLYELIKDEYEEVKEKEDSGESAPDSTGGSTSDEDSDGEGSGDSSDEGEGEGKSKTKSVPGLSPAPTGKSPFEDVDIDSEGDASGEERRDPGFSDEDYSRETPELSSDEGGRINNDVEGEASSYDSTGSTGDSESEAEKAEKAMDDFLKRIEDLAELEEKKMTEEATEKAGKVTDEKISDEIGKCSGAHEGVRAEIIEAYSNESAYDRIYATVSSYVEDTSRRLKALFDSLDRNYTKRGLWYGGRMNFRTAYRPDLGYYQRDIVNDPKADLALFVLVDESGSMSWYDRIPAATRATVLLEAVSRSINIPCAIYGHTERDCVELIKYRDFDDEENKKYNIPSMDARSDNRDGYALKFALEKLKERPEENKLLIIISDGQPAARNYYGREAVKDMQGILNSYKGIQLIAAAIGNDQEVIEEIYGSRRFLDCSDLSTMGEKLVKVLQKASIK